MFFHLETIMRQVYCLDWFYELCPKFIINNFKKIKNNLLNRKLVIVGKIKLQLNCSIKLDTTIWLIDTTMSLTLLMIQLF